MNPEWALRILGTSLNGLYVRDLEARLNVFVSAECTRLTGYTLEQLNALTEEEFLNLFHREDQRRILDHWAALRDLRDGQVLNIEYRFRRADGQWIWLLSRDTVLERDEDGAVRLFAGTFLDISEQRATLGALRESEARFRAMADDLPLLIWVHDARGHLEFVNRTFCEFFGVDAEEMHGDLWHPLMHPDDSDAVFSEFRASASERRPFHAETRVRRADGAWRLLESWARPRFAPDGTFLGFVGTSVDITERRRTEDALRRSEERLRLAAEAAGFGTYDCDVLRREEYWSPQMYAIFGLPEGVTVPQDLFMERVHSEDRDRFARAIEAALDPAGPHRFEFEVRIVRPDGDVRWVRDQGRTFFVSEGEGEGMQAVRTVGTVLDVTDRIRAVEVLRESEQRLRLLAIASGDAIYDWDIVSGGIWWNDAYDGRFHEGDQTRPTLMSWAQRIHPDDRARVVASLDQACRGSASDWSAEYRFQRTDGAWTYVLDRCHIARDSSGRAIRGVGTMVDLTERKRLEDALQEENRRKDAFLATLAHELRNPLAPIKAGLDAVQISNCDPAVTSRALPTMQRQMALVARLVDDLVDVSRITRGKIALQKERVDARDIIRRALETSVAAHASSRRTVRVDLSEQPLLLDADPMRLVQLVGNLLDNAAKYTAAGGTIWIRAVRERDQALIVVRDDGRGIPKAMLESIFDMFLQADPGRGSGLGIGLTLARHLARLHGGDIEARSDGPGRGSTFTVRLPLAARASESDAPRTTDALPDALRQRVLVVDDNPDVADSFGMLLEVLGTEVRIVHDGPAALALLDEFRPEIAFLDIGMAGMDGCELAQRIRNRPDAGGVVLVALTGWSHDEVRRRIVEAGFDHHLVKPATMQALQTILAGGNPTELGG